MMNLRLILYICICCCSPVLTFAQQYEWQSSRSYRDPIDQSKRLTTRTRGKQASYWKRKAPTKPVGRQDDEVEKSDKLYLGDGSQRKQDSVGSDLRNDFIESDVDSDDDEPEIDYSDEDPLEQQQSSVESGPALTSWPKKSIFEIRVDPREYSVDAPSDESVQLLTSYGRDWNRFAVRQKFLAWDAPEIRYHPLYFEDVALERYGQVFGNDYFQTVKSGSHFFTSFLLWPLHARHDPVFSCDTPLGYCRPGSNTCSIYEKKIWGRLPR